MTGPLKGQSIGYRWIPSTMVHKCRVIMLFLGGGGRGVFAWANCWKTVELPVIWNTTLMWRQCMLCFVPPIFIKHISTTKLDVNFFCRKHLCKCRKTTSSGHIFISQIVNTKWTIRMRYYWLNTVLCKQKCTCCMSWCVYSVAVQPVIIGKHDKLIHVWLVLMFTHQEFCVRSRYQE